MQKSDYFIGLDIASDNFVASIYESPEKPLITKEAIENNPDGFSMLISWLKEHGIDSSNSIICMEATGIYSEAVSHYLAANGFRVSVEPPLKVKRAFDPIGHKTDPVDSKQIAEYAYRYSDELRFWQPKQEIVEKIKQLLTAREQFTKQSTAIQNSIKAYERHVIKVPLIIKAHHETLKELKKHIVAIDKELDHLIRQNPTISQMTNHLKSIPGVGLLLASDLIAITGAFDNISGHKILSSFIGICPYQHTSGKSVYRHPRIRNFGPVYTRKLLMLAACSCSTHNTIFRKYYLRKLAEGKAKKLVLNNIANKIIKIACVLIKNNTQYNETYRSINPLCFNLT
ncbi:MAG: IS110 family transposase [Candidatus Omnitrophica bacterium]|nr:IS110 family transposase [Candidatus Omnitrophota bacterium]